MSKGLSLLLIAWVMGPGSFEPFRPALPGRLIQFPQDHGVHEEFETEWWYFTGHLESADGRPFGYELTFFRRGNRAPEVLQNPSRWSIRQLYLAHFALTDLSSKKFDYGEKISREALGKAGAETGHLSVHIDDWRAEERDGGILLSAGENFGGIRLILRPEKPPVLHGKGGFSPKGPLPGEASHYYSLTRLRTEGNLSDGGRDSRVKGLSWMDHEFFTSPALTPSGGAQGPGRGEEVAGWDWFSIQLQDRLELMFYRLRGADGAPTPYSAGTLIYPDGSSRPLSASQVRAMPLAWWTSPRSGARYPIRWALEIPDEGLSLVVDSLLENQELITRRSTRVTYWEGATRIAGRWGQRPVGGEGYLELTGYAREGTGSGVDAPR